MYCIVTLKWNFDAICLRYIDICINQNYITSLSLHITSLFFFFFLFKSNTLMCAIYYMPRAYVCNKLIILCKLNDMSKPSEYETPNFTIYNVSLWDAKVNDRLTLNRRKNWGSFRALNVNVLFIKPYMCTYIYLSRVTWKYAFTHFSGIFIPFIFFVTFSDLPKCFVLPIDIYTHNNKNNKSFQS